MNSEITSINNTIKEYDAIQNDPSRTKKERVDAGIQKRKLILKRLNLMFPKPKEITKI